MNKSVYRFTLYIVLLLSAYYCRGNDQIDSLKQLYYGSEFIEDRLNHVDLIARLYTDFQLDSAKVYAQYEINLANECDNSKYAARGINWLGEAYLREGHTDSALIHFKEGYYVNIKVGNKLYAAYSLMTIGGCYLQSASFDSSIVYYQRSLDQLNEIGDERGISYAHDNIALAYGKMGKYALAMEHIYHSIRISQEMHDTEHLAQSFERLASVFLQIDQIDSSIYYYNKTIRIFGKEQASYTLGNLFNNLGVAFEATYKYDSALYYYKNSLLIKRKVNDFMGLGTSYMNIGLILNNKKIYDSALIYFRKSEKIFKEIEYENGLTHNYLIIGNLFDSIQNYDSAIWFHLNSYQLAKKLNIHEYLQKSAFALSYDFNMLDDNKQALSYYKIFKNYEDSLFNEESSEKIGWIKAKYEFDKKLIKEEQKQKQLYKWITGIGLLAMTLMFLLWIIIRQLNQKKQLIKKLIIKDSKVVGLARGIDNLDDTENNEQPKPDEKITHMILQKLDKWIDKELYISQNVSLDSLSEYCGTNPKYLSYVLNRILKTRFSDWLNRLRLHKAKKLLADPNERKFMIEVIAGKSGFKNKSTFYKYFKKDMGITPMQYIRNIKYYNK